MKGPFIMEWVFLVDLKEGAERGMGYNSEEFLPQAINELRSIFKDIPDFRIKQIETGFFPLDKISVKNPVAFAIAFSSDDLKDRYWFVRKIDDANPQYFKRKVSKDPSLFYPDEIK